MVALNKNLKPDPAPKKNPRCAEPEDKVDPRCESDLICELADPATSLQDLCDAQGISLETLCLWMVRPDVAERLDLMKSAAMERARFIGTLTLPKAAQSAANIVDAYQLIPQKRTIDYAFDSGLHRANEVMLKAARFLQRLTIDHAVKNPARRKHAAAKEAPQHPHQQPSSAPPAGDSSPANTHSEFPALNPPNSKSPQSEQTRPPIAHAQKAQSPKSEKSPSVPKSQKSHQTHKTHQSHPPHSPPQNKRTKSSRNPGVRSASTAPSG